MSTRETFASRLGLLATMIGTAVGLGNVWRFPYMVGRYGGAAFVMMYLGWALLVGIPALVAEWSLGRHTRRGTVGAFEGAGLPGGRWIGWFFFVTVTAATAYYCNAIGWVLWHGLAELTVPLAGASGPADGPAGLLDPGRALPPDDGFDATSFLLQAAGTLTVVGACAAVLLQGLRKGIERASRIITPALFAALLVLIVRGLTLPDAGRGVAWLFMKFDPAAVTGGVALAALSQLVFSLALGGTFMVVYGSYLADDEPLKAHAVWTVVGDTAAGLLAGLAIFPAVFALGLEASSGPGLIFDTLPGTFRRMPAGWLFGTLFFGSLAAAAYLSAVAAFEVLVAGLTDNTGLSRRKAVWAVVAGVLLLAVPPMVNMRVFVPWDLTFGSGMQTLGALVAAVTVGWALRRAAVLEQVSGPAPGRADRLLVLWIRWVVPGAILAAGTWWLLTDVLGTVASV